MEQSPSWEGKSRSAQLVKKFPAFYCTRMFIIASQQPTSGPYTELDESSSQVSTLFLWDPY